jgi:hypothetical protein
MNFNKILYLLAMYTCVRAALNQIHGFFLPLLRVSILHGSTLRLNSSGDVKVCVNAKMPSGTLNSDVKAGMFSIYLLAPGIPTSLYRLLRLTSHFGTGHIEMAFYEHGDAIVFFAVRNILRSNIERLGMGIQFSNLGFNSKDDEIIALQLIFQDLGSRGIEVAFAPPEECIELAISKSLLIKKTRDRTIDSMLRRYKRIEKQIKFQNQVSHIYPH